MRGREKGGRSAGTPRRLAACGFFATLRFAPLRLKATLALVIAPAQRVESAQRHCCPCAPSAALACANAQGATRKRLDRGGAGRTVAAARPETAFSSLCLPRLDYRFFCRSAVCSWPTAQAVASRTGPPQASHRRKLAVPGTLHAGRHIAIAPGTRLPSHQPRLAIETVFLAMLKRESTQISPSRFTVRTQRTRPSAAVAKQKPHRRTPGTLLRLRLKRNTLFSL